MEEGKIICAKLAVTHPNCPIVPLVRHIPPFVIDRIQVIPPSGIKIYHTPVFALQGLHNIVDRYAKEHLDGRFQIIGVDKNVPHDSAGIDCLVNDAVIRAIGNSPEGLDVSVLNYRVLSPGEYPFKGFGEDGLYTEMFELAARAEQRPQLLELIKRVADVSNMKVESQD